MPRKLGDFLLFSIEFLKEYSSPCLRYLFEIIMKKTPFFLILLIELIIGYMEKLNSKGFSLLQVLIAAGLTAGLALTMMRMGQNQSMMQRKATEDLDTNQFYQNVQKHLLDSDACRETLSSASGLHNEGDSAEIASIKDKAGNVIYNKVDKLPSPSIKINSLRVLREKGENIKLEMYVEKVREGKSFGANKILRKIDLIAKFQGGNIIKCYSQLDNAVVTAKKEMCLDLCAKAVGANPLESNCWDSTTNTCLVGTKGRVIYQDAINGQMTLDKFASSRKSCSKCRRECNPCAPGETMIDRGCSLGKNCKIVHRWRNCEATCVRTSPNSILGKILYFDSN